MNVAALLLSLTLLGPSGKAIVMPSTEVIVVDGDTLRVGPLRLRINGIDAPEMAQPGGRTARERMKYFVATGSVITCRIHKTDRYGRSLATCFDIHNNDLADLIVREGYAFAYREYSLNYVLAEDEARENKAGLWKGEVVFPWDYRSRRRK